MSYGFTQQSMSNQRIVLVVLVLLTVPTALTVPAAHGQADGKPGAGLDLKPISLTLDPSASVRRVAIHDTGPAAGKLGAPPPRKGAPGTTTILFEGAEGAWPGPWSLFDTDPASGDDFWGDVSCRSFNGAWSVWCADIPNTDCTSYDNDMNSWMVFGPFSLADALAAQAQFMAWSEVEDGFDGLSWLASTDGTNFFGFQSQQDFGWSSIVFDFSSVPTLGDLRGDGSVWFALVFNSDSTIAVDEGVYVDDILIEKDVGTTQRLSDVAGLIVPGFEVEVANSTGPTVFFGVRNTTNGTINVDVDYYGKQIGTTPLRTDAFTFGPQATLSENVRSDLSGLEVVGGFAEGIMVITEGGTTAPNLVGDYFRVDSGNDFAAGDRMFRPSDFCLNQEIRAFDFGSGTVLRILVDQPQGPSSPSFSYMTFNEAGTMVMNGSFITSDHLTVADISQFAGGTSFGTVVFNFTNSGGGFATARYSAFGRFSVELEAACLD